MLVVMGADGDDQSVDEMGGPAHDVDMPVGDGIEASAIKTYTHASISMHDGRHPSRGAGLPGRASHLLAAQVGNEQGAYRGVAPFGLSPGATA